MILAFCLSALSTDAAGISQPTGHSTVITQKRLNLNYDFDLTRRIRKKTPLIRQPRLALLNSRSDADKIENLYQCYAQLPNGDYPMGTVRFVFYPAQNRVTIYDLGSFCGTMTDMLPVTADFTNGRITIDCDTYTDGTGDVYLGIWEDSYEVYLTSGVYDNGMLDMEKSLTFIVSDDYKTITTEGAKTIVGVAYEDGWQTVEYVRDVKYGYTEPKYDCEISTDALSFRDILPGQRCYRTVTLQSHANVDIDYNVVLPAEFTLEKTAGTVPAGGAVTLPVAFSPTSPGEYAGDMTVTVRDKVMKVSLQARALVHASDFSAIVKGGSSFLTGWNNNLTEDYPWILDGDKAYPSNVGNGVNWRYDDMQDPVDCTSTLRAGYNAADKALKLTFDYAINDIMLDRLSVLANGQELQRISDSSGSMSLILPAGVNNLDFDYVVSPSWKDYATAYISNLILEPVEQWSGLSPDLSVTDISASGWNNYNATARSFTAGDRLEIKTDNTSEAYINFKYNGELRVEVDNTTVMTLSGEGRDAINLNGGIHTVSFISCGSAALSSLTLRSGVYKIEKSSYTLLAIDYFDDDGWFEPNSAITRHYNVDISRDTNDDVVIEGLFPANYYFNHINPINGSLAADGSLEIPVGGFIYGYTDDSYRFADYGVYGDEYELVAGEMISSNDVNFAEPLIFDADNDLLALRSRSGVGLRYLLGRIPYGYQAFLRKVLLLKETETPAVVASDRILEAAITSVGATIPFNILLGNPGPAADFAIAIEGDSKDDFTLSENNITLEQLTPSVICVTFKPSHDGAVDAAVVIRDADGEECLRIPIAATVAPAADYSSIVSRGSDLIQWTTEDTAYPFTVEDNIARSTNIGKHATSSSLTANIIVPEGKVASLSFHSSALPEPERDKFFILSDNETIVECHNRENDRYTSLALGAGTHAIKFIYKKDSRDMLPYKGDYVTLSNVAVDLFEASSGAPVATVSRQFFERELAKGTESSETIDIINAGSTAFTIESATTPEGFSVKIPADGVVNPGARKSVVISALPAAAGTMGGDIIITTSAGNITIPVSAEVEQAVYAGKPTHMAYNVPYCLEYIRYGIWPITHRYVYPSDMLAKLPKGAVINSVTFYSVAVSDVDFIADTQWQIGDAENAFIVDDEAIGLTTVYEGEQFDIDNYHWTIAFDKPYIYTGGNLQLQCKLLSRENDFNVSSWPFIVTAPDYCAASAIFESNFGLQTINHLPYMKISYSGVAKIDNIQDAGSLTGDGTIYDLYGRRVANPVEGTLYIRDGEKFIFR